MTFASEAGHWYDQDGNPAYEVVAKNGELRPTTLRDARKLNLVPSVSGIIKMAAAPALENWKVDQGIMASLTLPRIEGEELEEFAKRVKLDSQEQAKKARELGSTIHGCIEGYLCERGYDSNYAEHVIGAVDALHGWCGVSDIRPEKSFAHPLGYGGKCDVHKPDFVADFKSKDFTQDNLPDVYENHAMQLAAYREGFNMLSARCAIIYVSTSVPGLTHLVELGEEELDRGWDMFVCLLRFWQLKNKYTPQTTLTKAAEELFT